MADVDRKLASIHYYAREMYYRRVATSVLEVVRETGPEPVLTFWKAYSIIMEERLAEGMRELEPILDKRDVVLCVPLLLIYAHKKCNPVDREAVHKLEAKVRSERTTCGEKALYNAGMFLWLIGRNDKAREYTDRLLKMAPSSSEALALKGWIDLTSGREALVKKSIQFFDKSLSGPEQPKALDGLLGKAQYFLSRHNFSSALEVVNQAVASYPGFIPPLLEKTRVFLALQDWEQAIETAHRCLGLESSCIEAVRMLALSLLAREGGVREAAGRLSDLVQLVDRLEPSNHQLYYHIALTFSRLSEGNPLVTQQTITLVERALSLAPTNALYITELAYQYRICGQLKESLQNYRKAFNIDETSVSSLAGIIYCQISNGQLVEAEQQLEFLTEVQSSIGRQSDLVFLHALLDHKRQKPSSEVVAGLEEALDLHCNAVKGTPLSERYYQLINPWFLHQLATILMSYAPTKPASHPSQVPMILRKASRPVEVILKCAPGMIRALSLLAKIKFLSGEVEGAQALVQQCLQQDGSSTELQLLLAQIHLQQGSVKQASYCLEQALSSNFEVQDYAVYHLVKAQTDKLSGALDKALSSLQTALELISSRKPVKSLLPPLSSSECVTVYLELAGVHSQLGQAHEASKVMQDAINAYAGTPEEVRISIANADLAISRGDTDQALTILKSIGDDKPYYIQAVEKMADIYYKHRKDKKMYVACYVELSSKLPGPPTALLLGDAYMNVQEPELAVGVYESALKSNPRDSVLASKVGQALIKTHHYNKAINYYEAALKTGNQPSLRSELAELHLKLKNYDRAERTLTAALDHKDQENADVGSMMEDVQYLLLLARVHEQAKKSEQSLATLSTAREVQLRVINRVGIEQADTLPPQKQLAAKICSQMADIYLESRNFPEAQRLYKDALFHSESYSEARLALADLHLQRGELDACEQECVTLLRTDPDNERASLMRADLLSRKGDYVKAAGHFQDILRKKPDHFEALERLIELNRREGELDKSSFYLDEAEKACARSAYKPGLNYCKGLMKRYRHSVNDALQCFNHARNDSQWGEKAVFSMVEICINPENETLGGETFKSLDGSQAVSSHEDQMGVKTAEKLLKEVHPKTVSSEIRRQVLENYILLATKNKQNAEKALENFTELATSERDSVPVLLGMATAHMILKHTPRARNQLKRVSKMTWTSGEAEEFEKSWLLLADIFIQANKLDVASELLKKCLSFNKSCSKAWEYRGYMAEKESAYKDAATYYEQAWKYCYFSDPNIGYKLAFNYLKARKFVGAIEVCHKILEKHPSYPRIKKEILDKARLSLRP